MCLAIAPNNQKSDGPLAKLWRRISSTPLKLFSFGAAAHLVFSAGIISYVIAEDAPLNTNALLFAFSYGILAFIIFGYLMTFFPKKYALSPIHYGRYNSSYLFMMISLLMIETGALLSSGLVTTGMILMLPAWIIALQGIRNMLGWISNESQKTCRIILFLLSALFASQIISSLTVLSDEHHDMFLMLNNASLILWLAVVLSSWWLLSKAPVKVRAITI